MTNAHKRDLRDSSETNSIKHPIMILNDKIKMAIVKRIISFILNTPNIERSWRFILFPTPKNLNKHREVKNDRTKQSKST